MNCCSFFVTFSAYLSGYTLTLPTKEILLIAEKAWFTTGLYMAAPGASLPHTASAMLPGKRKKYTAEVHINSLTLHDSMYGNFAHIYLWNASNVGNYYSIYGQSGIINCTFRLNISWCVVKILGTHQRYTICRYLFCRGFQHFVPHTVSTAYLGTCWHESAIGKLRAQ